MEKEVTGLYLSGHPMGEYFKQAQSMGAESSNDILAAFDDSDESATSCPMGKPCFTPA
jgi:DNA polymerase III alpha subunit